MTKWHRQTLNAKCWTMCDAIRRNQKICDNFVKNILYFFPLRCRLSFSFLMNEWMHMCLLYLKKKIITRLIFIAHYFWRLQVLWRSLGEQNVNDVGICFALPHSVVYRPSCIIRFVCIYCAIHIPSNKQCITSFASH